MKPIATVVKSANCVELRIFGVAVAFQNSMFKNDFVTLAGQVNAAAVAAQFVPANTPELRTADNPELDGTDDAHPAFWRGHDQAVRSMCSRIMKILAGKDEGTPTNVEPWASTRKSLNEMVSSERFYKNASELQFLIRQRIAARQQARIATLEAKVRSLRTPAVRDEDADIEIFTMFL